MAQAVARIFGGLVRKLEESVASGAAYLPQLNYLERPCPAR